MRLIVMEDDETHGLLDGCMILEVDVAGLEALDCGENIYRLIAAGRAIVVAEVHGECVPQTGQARSGARRRP